MERLTRHAMRHTFPLLLLACTGLYNLALLLAPPDSIPPLAQQVLSLNSLLLGLALLWLIATYLSSRRRLQQLQATMEALLRGECDTAEQISHAAAPDDAMNRLAHTFLQLQRSFANERQYLQQEQARVRAIFNQAADGILFVASDGHVLTLNPAAERLTGYTSLELTGRPLSHLLPNQPDSLSQLHGQQLERPHSQGVEVQLRRKDGSWLSAEITLSRMGEAQRYQYVVIISDLTAYKEAQACIDFLAYYDPLTGLPNRILLLDRLTHAMQLCKRSHKQLALLYLDLDHFKTINNSLGFSGGDALLKQVANRLSEQLREEDTLARLEGDRFIIVQENLDTPAAAEGLAHRLLQTFTRPFSLQEHTLLVTPSIGISLSPQHAMEAEQLLKAAEIAMQHAKRQGHNQYSLYTPAFDQHAQQRMTLEQQLRHALQREEFLLCYQPQASLHDGTVVGIEALVRWRSRERGLVLPDEFIPALVDLHLMPQLTRWILRTACRQARHWHQAGYPLTLTVNLSAQDLQQDNLPVFLREVLQEHQLDGQTLMLDLPETVLADHSTYTQNTLDSLIAQGITLNLNNFGIGRVPFDQLQRCGIHSVRLERTFTQQLPTDRHSCELSENLLRMAHRLGLRVIAEGVETAQQYHYLRQQGYDLAQGFLICRPLTSEQLETFLQERQRQGTFSLNTPQPDR